MTYEEELQELIAVLEEDPERAFHMKLLADAFYENLQRDNVEYGGLGLDSKRPFGNSDVTGDIANIVGVELPSPDHHEDEYREMECYLDDLYSDLGLYLKWKWSRLIW